jgi:excisionase family DNA binding protein
MSGQNAKAPEYPLLKIRDAAAYLGMSCSWFKQSQHARQIPYVRLGAKSKRWRKEDLDSYIERSRRGVAS